MSKLGVFLFLALLPVCFGQDATAGRKDFEGRCAGCHGGDGNGGEHGPSITQRLSIRNDQELATLIRNGFPGSGMPGFHLADRELRDLVAFLRTLPPPPGQEVAKVTVTIDGEGQIEGSVLARSTDELQRCTSSRIHLLRKTARGYRRVTSESDWPAYNGTLDGNRYGPLDQLDVNNVGHLSPVWIFPVSNGGHLQLTPWLRMALCTSQWRTSWVAKGDAVAQRQFIHTIFGIAA